MRWGRRRNRPACGPPLGLSAPRGARMAARAAAPRRPPCGGARRDRSARPRTPRAPHNPHSPTPPLPAPARPAATRSRPAPIAGRTTGRPAPLRTPASTGGAARWRWLGMRHRSAPTRAAASPAPTATAAARCGPRAPGRGVWRPRGAGCARGAARTARGAPRRPREGAQTWRAVLWKAGVPVPSPTPPHLTPCPTLSPGAQRV
jgi:hypothetical protein